MTTCLGNAARKHTDGVAAVVGIATATATANATDANVCAIGTSAAASGVADRGAIGTVRVSGLIIRVAASSVAVAAAGTMRAIVLIIVSVCVV